MQRMFVVRVLVLATNCDIDLAGDIRDQKSTSGCVVFTDGPVQGETKQEAVPEFK